jgi:hypothetical protein
LESRGIDSDIIDDCIKHGSLYETATWHNCCFVGRDEHGKARFAALRGTLGDYKRDADGSDKRFGFCLPPADPNSNTVFVYESPIDALSHKALFPDSDGYRLSLGGTALTALTRFLTTHPKISDCLICTDNDAAGNRAADKIRNTINIATARLLPPTGKDWSEALQKIRNEVNPMQDVRKDIIFRDNHYKEKFRIKDGDSIKVMLGYDGEVVTRKCRWIDECHTKIGSEYFHADEYAEKSARAGNKTEPMPSNKPTIDILAAKYGENLQDVSIPMTDAAIRKLVGGAYETETLYNWDKKYILGALVRGKDGIAVCGLGGRDNDVLTSLHPYNAQTYKKELSPATRKEPEKSVTQPKKNLLGDLAEAKGIVAERKAAVADNTERAAPKRPAEER